MICRSSYSRAIISRERCPIKSLLFLEKLLAPMQLRRYARSWPECCDGPASSDPWLLVSRPIGCMRAPLDFSHFPQLSVEPLLLCVCIVVTRRHKGKRASWTKKKSLLSAEFHQRALRLYVCVRVCVHKKKAPKKKKKPAVMFTRIEHLQVLCYQAFALFTAKAHLKKERSCREKTKKHSLLVRGNFDLVETRLSINMLWWSISHEHHGEGTSFGY